MQLCPDPRISVAYNTRGFVNHHFVHQYDLEGNQILHVQLFYKLINFTG
jgi:hypothetical protein